MEYRVLGGGGISAVMHERDEAERFLSEERRDFPGARIQSRRDRQAPWIDVASDEER